MAAARATRDLAESEFARIRSLLDQKVVSQAEFDQRRTQVEATSNQYRAARNAAQQQFRMLEGAKARLALATEGPRRHRRARAVRGSGHGAEGQRRRLRHARHQGGDGGEDRAAPGRTHRPRTVGRIHRPGETVRLQVDAYPGRYFEAMSGSSRRRSARISAPSPSRPSSRIPDDVLKPGMFVVGGSDAAGGCAVDGRAVGAVSTVAGMSHVFVVRGTGVEQRMITTGLTPRAP